MDTRWEQLEAKLKAVDWKVQDVLVGTVRSAQQLESCREHRFYYVPAEYLEKEALSIRYIALYQSPYLFGPQAGIRYCGEVTKCSAVCRGDITEVPARKGTEQTPYYRFEVKEWKQLNRPVAARETCFVRGLTNLFLLRHSAETPQLWLHSEEEYRLYAGLMCAVNDAAINEEDNDLGFAFRGFTVSFKNGKILVADEGCVFGRYEITDFLQNAEAVFRKLYRDCIQRDAMNEISEI